MMGILLRLVNK